MCKNYLRECTTFSSFHTSSEFLIQDKVDCNTPGVVYLINDIICKRSSVGCTTDSTNVRFRNHKSHIKYGRKTCIVSKHFAENQQWHKLDLSSQTNYDNVLKTQVEIIIIEKVKIPDNVTDIYEKLKYCEARKKHWTEQLRTLEEYGGKRKLTSRFSPLHFSIFWFRNTEASLCFPKLYFSIFRTILVFGM